MKKIIELYKLINILSLDVAAGAMVCSSFFARLTNVDILPQGLISLGLTVWIIYTADHLLDARKLKQEASTERHRFHQQHFKLLSLLLLIAIIIDATQIYFIRSMVFVSGLELAFLVGVYFLVQRQIGFLKELLGTLLYTGGVLLVPYSLNNQWSLETILLIIQFGIIVWINLLLFSWIDKPRDEKDRHRSFATIFGLRLTKMILIFLFVVVTILSAVQLAFFLPDVKTIGTLTLMAIVLLMIFLNKDYFEKEDRYRLLGDAVFLLPILYLILTK
jgi:hypothetical protein